jgi:hypothetical protein
LVFEPFDLLAHRGLGAVDAFASLREAAGIDDRHEAAEKLYIHHWVRPIYETTDGHSII